MTVRDDRKELSSTVESLASASRLSQASLIHALCIAAIEAWRLERLRDRLCDVDRIRVQSIAERLTAGLAQDGVLVEDLIGREYVEGLAVDVIAIEERADLPTGTQRIAETVKPSVYVGGIQVARGQVILARGVETTSGTQNGTRLD